MYYVRTIGDYTFVCVKFVFVMLLAVSITLSFIGGVWGQSTTCPSQEEIIQCSTYVKDLADRTTVPIHNVFTSKTYFITPLDWNLWETEQVCRVKEEYKLFLQCAVQKIQRCVLENRRQPFMSAWRINRAINFLCDNYRCDDCSRKWCWRCEKDRYFNYDCTKQAYPELASCMKPYENRIYQPTTSDVNLQREQFNDYQCGLIEHHRTCTRRAYKTCDYYTANITDWYTDYARPAVCSATSTAMSAILVFITTILAIFN